MTNEIVLRPVDSLQMMAYIIKRCDVLGVELNITKLQKLMYCCYGVVLGKCGLRLIDEYPAAWQYGPVFPAALRAVQFFHIDGVRKNQVDVSLPQNVVKLIDETLSVFGKNSATALSRWTHLPGSPLDKASLGGKILYGRISDNDIQDYFRNKVLA